MHILKYQEWQSPTGAWHCNDVSDLAGISGYWWVPARMLGLAPADYIQWLIDNYKPDTMYWNGKTFLFSWTKEHYAQCHRFVLDINRIARNKKFMC